MSFVGSARLIGGITLVSRILGMVRDILASHFLGAGMVWDAFTLAHRVPNLFRRLFGEGALTAAFIPAFVRRLEAGKREEAFQLLRRLVTALTLILGLVVIVGIATTSTFASDPKSQLEGTYLRIMLPYVVLICGGAILGAALNGLRQFFAPAFAPVIANIVSIATLLMFAGVAPHRLAWLLAWSVILGGVLQFISMAIPLARRGASLRPELAPRDPALREVGAQFAPLVLGLSLVQINEFLNTLIARWCIPGDGAVSALYYGNQLTQLPLSLVGTAIGTAIFPLMATAAANKRLDDLSHLVAKGVRGALYLAIPATAGLIGFSQPIIELIFEHGAFTATHTERASRVMIFYSLSLWCYCANQVQVRAFYAQGNVKTPVRVAASMVAFALALSLILVRFMGEAGISLATSLSGLGSFLTLQILHRKHMPAHGRELARTFLLSLFASSLMIAVAWGCRLLLPTHIDGLSTTVLRAGRLGIPTVLAVIVYIGLTRWFNMPEAKHLFRRV